MIGVRPTRGAQVRVLTARRSLRIGDMDVCVSRPRDPQNVPVGYARDLQHIKSPQIIAHLRWLAQKDRLGQDCFLMGPPGPLRRRLVMSYCELAQREVEVLTLSQDTTESDLKQRKEIINGSSLLVDQAPVRAALKGRILVVDGIEKAERNVLPTLNNLLENREMSLSDGRFLVSPSRFDALLQSGHTAESLHSRGLVRVSPEFRVIALGLPVPEFPGFPIDPPLRSRFQGRYVSFTHSPLIQLHQKFSPTEAVDTFFRALSALRGSTGGLLDSQRVLPAPISATVEVASLLQMFPAESTISLIQRIYPFHLFGLDAAQQEALVSLMDNVSSSSGPVVENGYRIQGTPYVEQTSSDQCQNCLVEFLTHGNGNSDLVRVPVKTGSIGTDRLNTSYVPIGSHQKCLTQMMQTHALGYDICVVGSKGCGKSILADHFSRSLGYLRPEIICCYKDMTSRDLLQRRRTDHAGNTQWVFSPLVVAALEGNIAVLDGVNRLTGDALSVLAQLIRDRELHLPDGRRLLRHDRYDSIVAKIQNGKLENALRIHPSFRLLALGTPPDRENPWLSAEVLGMFPFIETLHSLSIEERMQVVSRRIPPETLADRALLQSLRGLCGTMDIVQSDPSRDTKMSVAAASTSLSPSCRQLLRLWQGCREQINTVTDGSLLNDQCVESVVDIKSRVQQMFMVPFMPNTLRETFDEILDGQRTLLSDCLNDVQSKPYQVSSDHNTKPPPMSVRIGDVLLPRNTPQRPELVPDTHFIDIPAHMLYLQRIAHDIAAGERNILLIGNQGTGKNKLVDRLLHLVGWEREYMQLHRDTTVQSLTVTPTLSDGVITYDDSPVVKAVKHGRVLVLVWCGGYVAKLMTLFCQDEADKAPTEIVVVLKGLLEDGQLVLEDGRCILSTEKYESMCDGFISDKYIPIHSDFRVFVLANRPGYPFLGNDFFRESGDCFSVHIIDNPPVDSQIEMLRAYAKNSNAKEHVIRKLTAAFNDLRDLYEEGLLSYPYSMREMVGVIRHHDNFPEDGVAAALDNVLSWDGIGTGAISVVKGDEEHSRSGVDSSSDIIRSVLVRHGIASSDLLPGSTKACLTNYEDHLRATDRDVVRGQPFSMRVVGPYETSAKVVKLNTSNSSFLFGRRKGVAAKSIMSTRSLVFSEEIQRWNIGTMEEGSDSERAVPSRIAVTNDNVLITTTKPASLHSYERTDLNNGTAVDISSLLGSTVCDMSVHNTLDPGSIDRVLLHALSGSFAHSLSASGLGEAQRIEMPEVIYGKASQSAAWLVASRRKQSNQSVVSGQASSIDGTVIGHCGCTMFVVYNQHMGNRYESCVVSVRDTFSRMGLKPAVSIINSWALSKTDFVLQVGEPGDKLSLVHVNIHPPIPGEESSDARVLCSLIEFPEYMVNDLLLSVNILPTEASVFGEFYSEGSILFHSNDALYIAKGMCGSSTGADAEANSRNVPLTHVSIPGSSKNSQVVRTCFVEPSYENEYTSMLVVAKKEPSSLDIINLTTSRVHSLDLESDLLSVPRTELSPSPEVEVSDAAVHDGDGSVEVSVLFSNGMVRTFNAASNGAASGEKRTSEYHDIAGDIDPDEVMDIKIQDDSGELVSLFSGNESDRFEGPVENSESGLAGEVGAPSIPGDIGGNSATVGSQGGTDGSGGGIGSGGGGGGGYGGGGGGGSGGQAGGGGGGGSGGALASDGKGGYSDSQKKAMESISAAQTIAIEETIVTLVQRAQQAAEDVKRASSQRVDTSETQQVQLSPGSLTRYDSLLSSVKSASTQLRVILESAEAKQREREWLKNQLSGDIDDQKLVDGITGDGRVYRRRGRPDKKHGMYQSKPKRLAFLLDCSASMARMSSWDGRLDRMAACAVLVMEALQGFEHKFDYSIVGHSGLTSSLPLVNFGNPPKSAVERAAVIDAMYSHARSAPSGDKSLEAAAFATQDIVQEPADDYIVFLFSDANLGRYGVSPSAMASALRGDGRSQGYCIFVAEPSAASWLVDNLPFGRGFVVLDVDKLPQTFKEIFSHATAE